MEIFFGVIITTIAILTLHTPLTAGDWQNPSEFQYHIQTDEGPERYFRYQTHSGQYRKEKRLEDGTVIGTNAWIDPSGFLRQQDYIADNAGYRILKSKTVFVGRDVNVQDAIAIGKKAPASGGELVKSGLPVSPTYVRVTPKITSGYTTQAPVTPSYVRVTPTSYIPPSRASSGYIPPQKVSSGYIPPSYGVKLTPSSLGVVPIETSTRAPFVEISPNGIQSTTAAPPIYSTTESSIYSPSTTVLPPYGSKSSTTTSYYSTSTPVTPIAAYSTPITPIAAYSTPITPIAAYSTPITPIDSNSLSYNKRPVYTSNPIYDRNPSYQSNRYDNTNQRYYQSDPNYSNYYNSRNDGQYYTGSSSNRQYYGSNQIGDGYTPQFPQYDGVAVTNNGFRYYLPRQYHEEENSKGDQRSGSFGYIDPFGIRRVIYYNAGADGFVHRKNNRYVGFNATPYDPRPY